MIEQNLIIQLKRMSTKAKYVLLFASNRQGQQLYIKEIKELYKLTSKELDSCLIELASINIIIKDKNLLIIPLVKKIERSKDVLTIEINREILSSLQDHKSNMQDFINISKKDKNTCLLFALLVENNTQLLNEGLTVPLLTLKVKLQAVDKYEVLKDFQKNLISKPIRVLNNILIENRYTYSYIKKDRKIIGVKFSLINNEYETIEL